MNRYYTQRRYKYTLDFGSQAEKWWQSEAPFDLQPSALLKDSLSLYAQRGWQQYRHDTTLFHALNEHVTACFGCQRHCYFDLELHQRYPDLPLIKFWLASASCCCREYPVNQGDLWLQHLRLTQAMSLAMDQRSYALERLVGYGEQWVMIMDVGNSVGGGLLATADKNKPAALYIDRLDPI